MNLTGKPSMGLKSTEDGKDPAYLERVTQLPCCICDAHTLPQSPVIQAHHTTNGRFGQRKTPDRQAIPLCLFHHTMYHTQRAEFERQFGKDTDWIAVTQDRVDSMDG